MGEIGGRTIAFGESDAKPLIGVRDLESVGIEKEHHAITTAGFGKEQFARRD